MSVEIWPPIAPEQLKIAVETSHDRELDWLVQELRETLTSLKHSLEDCYALLAPIDPGSTLVLSTPRNEVVKGHVTRVGTRIVKGTIHLRLRTLPHQTLTINPDHPIHIGALTSLHTLLTSSIDLLDLTLSYSYPSSSAPKPNPTQKPKHPNHPSDSSLLPQFLSTQLRLLSTSLTEASALLKGPPLTIADPSWTTRSPADAPVNFGTKLALAIGTTRRLEHDESERVFGFCCDDVPTQDGGGGGYPLAHTKSGLVVHGTGRAQSVAGGGGGGGGVALSGTRRGISPGGKRPAAASVSGGAASGDNSHGHNGGGGNRKKEVEVFVREKVRVESADPSLLSLSSKLTALGHTLALARRNLASVMGEDGIEDEEGGRRGSRTLLSC
ncbi:RAVE subunit 2/Rogdi [Bombardia bombarda]|uniref:RAVE subunit 2/Rogdi n=1 Tax=Bombardia bombarda TaxID=252184 RepID=A0AA39U4T7_9PEZI|nr:RAVE subunit 2/Rogdi [Bombardia bombarda]